MMDSLGPTLDDALRSIHMTRSDMTLPLPTSDDPFRLPAVSAMFANPMSVVGVVDSLAWMVRNKRRSPSGFDDAVLHS